jgi:hypothetical protein
MQLVLIIVAALIVLALLAFPRAAKSAQQPPAPQNIAPNASLFRQWPSKYPGGTLYVELDGASKDPAKMTINAGSPGSKDTWKCSDVLLTASMPTGVVATAHPAVVGTECVASMKVPAGTPLTLNADFSHAGGWVESVAGDKASPLVVSEKVGADHIVHKHIAGVKYEDITVVAGNKYTVKTVIGLYQPQIPAQQINPSPK